MVQSMKRFSWEWLGILVLSAVLALFQMEGKESSFVTLDGIALGMSYDEVVGIRGLPSGLEWEQSLTGFNYQSGGPIWFEDGRVVFCAGKSLKVGPKKFQAGQSEDALRAILGWGQELEPGCRWFPQVGVTYGKPFTSEADTNYLSLRDPLYPIEFQPWWNHFDQTIEADGRVLGDNGYVLDVRQPKKVTISQWLGYTSPTHHFEVGKPPATHDWLLQNPPGETGWYQPQPHFNVRLDKGVIAEMSLRVEDSALREALHCDYSTVRP